MFIYIQFVGFLFACLWDDDNINSSSEVYVENGKGFFLQFYDELSIEKLEK